MTSPILCRVQQYCALALLLLALREATGSAAPTKVTINADLVLEVNGQRVFPIGFTLPPPMDGKTPEGKDALQELADAGGLFMRTGPSGGDWTEETVQLQGLWLDAAAKRGLYCWPFLRELASLKPEDTRREALLRDVVTRFKNHPGLLAWKGVDEPEWGQHPIPPLLRARAIIRDLDPNHPLTLIQAPRGTVASLRPYNPTGDILGTDIYPISYPPGTHSLLTNKTLSLVGDHTRIMMEVADGKMPVWMVLQIAWSGVVKPGKTLRFPTFPEERFMAYEAIICGARGLNFFGGNLPVSLNPADAKLGWNWTFWRRVLRPLLEEIGRHGPLHPALVAPNSKLPVKVSSPDIEFCVREVGSEVFILACRRGGPIGQVEFDGLPASFDEGEVLFESPRRVTVKDGQFSDWFAPFEVHVYRFQRGRPEAAMVP